MLTEDRREIPSETWRKVTPALLEGVRPGRGLRPSLTRRAKRITARLPITTDARSRS
jgi:hypothetical protein